MKNQKRLAVDLPIAVHNEIKVIATRRNITISKWVLRALVKALVEEQNA